MGTVTVANDTVVEIGDDLIRLRHRRTVLGDTMTRACLQPAHTVLRQNCIQHARRRCMCCSRRAGPQYARGWESAFVLTASRRPHPDIGSAEE